MSPAPPLRRLIGEPRWNPLYDLWQRHHPRGARIPGALFDFDIDSIITVQRTREEGLTNFAFAVPTPEAIAAIVAHAPRIVELGAGTGYWAKLLADAGADVVAFDSVPAGTANEYFTGQQVGRWFPVEVGTPASLAAHADRALFLCWPPMDAMAADALAAWRGETLVYVGENDGGCNADEAFFERRDAEFDTVLDLDLPVWPGIHDYLEILQRKKV